ncbi:MFS transporter [Kutzneria kofuensis]|uniref:EmrB/QacA subfamily drug resistance transporter n=1 Tax=Kutzneria kofuensis TaxID=103725 RepID=A0A7W9KMT2_9PSEU|nr:MFS transporter [Kutzneria kofuensis]MBB5895456.1 EmrB/QacA subfamily drug resistance transporter [Kutzneria kofuensis]
MAIPESPGNLGLPTLPAASAAVPEQPQDPAARRHALRVLALSSLGVFVVFLDTTIVNVAFETIGRGFRTTTEHLSWVLNIYSLVFAAALIPAGRLADRYGRKRVFLIGMTGFAVTSALCGLAVNVPVLIIARALQAAFAALAIPASLALVLPEFPASRRSVAIGTWGTMGAAAAAVGPTLGALLVQYASWRWIFLVNVPICALVLVVGLRLLRETREPGARGIPDPVGAVLIAAVPAALSLAIVEGPSWGWSDPRVIAAFVVATALFPVFLWRTRAAARPVMDLALFKVRQFRLVNAASLVFSVAFYGVILSNIVFLQTVWHYPVLTAALAAAPSPILTMIVARPASRLAHTYGHRIVLLAGAVLFAAAQGMLALTISSEPHWAVLWLPAMVVTGTGIGMSLPVQSGASAKSLPPARFAVGSAINQSFRQLGAVLGVSIFAAVAGTPGAGATPDAFHHVWWIFGALALAGGLLVWLPPLRRTAAA